MVRSLVQLTRSESDSIKRLWLWSLCVNLLQLVLGFVVTIDLILRQRGSVGIITTFGKATAILIILNNLFQAFYFLYTCFRTRKNLSQHPLRVIWTDLSIIAYGVFIIIFGLASKGIWGVPTLLTTCSAIEDCEHMGVFALSYCFLNLMANIFHFLFFHRQVTWIRFSKRPTMFMADLLGNPYESWKDRERRNHESDGPGPTNEMGEDLSLVARRQQDSIDQGSTYGRYDVSRV